MDPIHPTIRGRGAAGNPTSRFERLAFERDGDDLDAALEAGEESPPQTIYLKDASRSIIVQNDSPDVGFTHSINAYRGCSHGCVYCLSGDTPILMGDGTSRSLRDVRVGDSIFGTVRRGNYRYYQKTAVRAHWATRKPAYRITLEDGTTLVASGDHRFLTERGWKHVAPASDGQRPYLTTNHNLLGTGAIAAGPLTDEQYKRGYLCGLIRGDGHLATYRYARAGCAHGDQHQFRLALADFAALDRAATYLAGFGIATVRFAFQKALPNRRAIDAIRTHAEASVRSIESLIAWPEPSSQSWGKGFLAGIYDAEGCHSGGVLRISNTDSTIIRRMTDCLTRFGFRFVVEHIARSPGKPIDVVRICGGLKEHLRLFHATDPAITRKRCIDGQALKSAAPRRIMAIEALPGEMDLFDITTGTGDFIANGVVSHNCYARPTHEYLGFSAGLDFETKILVKEDAPQLLREELSAPRYQPVVLSMSGVTDCYQPAERKLLLTRRCLEVLAECRNPVGVITKNHLVTRDIDLLGELAAHRAAVAMVSITSLDPEITRRMEPRTSTPARRLAAVKALADAGIPVGVMVAPVIPGLTDHEMPMILKAAAEAGARWAGYVPVRLPLAVAPLFEDWLARHFPDRKDKVLNRIRDLRGGKLNDPNFGSRMRGQGVWAEQFKTIFALAKRKAGMDGPFPELSTAAFRRPPGKQMTLFG